MIIQTIPIPPGPSLSPGDLFRVVNNGTTWLYLGPSPENPDWMLATGFREIWWPLDSLRAKWILWRYRQSPGSR